jgi:hypothetical protein
MVRRRWPCIVVTAAVSSIGVQGHYTGSTPFLILIALYTVAAYRELPVALAGLVFGYGCIAVLVICQVPYFDHPSSVRFVAAVSGVWAFGRWMRGRQRDRDPAVAHAVEAERARAVAAHGDDWTTGAD